MHVPVVCGLPGNEGGSDGWELEGWPASHPKKGEALRMWRACNKKDSEAAAHDHSPCSTVAAGLGLPPTQGSARRIQPRPEWGAPPVSYSPYFMCGIKKSCTCCLTPASSHMVACFASRQRPAARTSPPHHTPHTRRWACCGCSCTAAESGRGSNLHSGRERPALELD